MTEMILLDPVRVLVGPDQPLQEQGAALLREGRLEALGEQAREVARSTGIPSRAAGHQLLAPCLVDVHSSLPEPFQGQGETLESLVRSAAAGGYGQLALLPEASANRRELPDRLRGFQLSGSDLALHLWGGFSQGGKGEQLTPHADLIEAGAVGLSDGDNMPPVSLLDRALTLGESGASPVLIPPLDAVLRGEGLLREGPEALRAGWPTDPLSSETLPLSQLAQLQQEHPQRKLMLMGLSTAASVGLLQQLKLRPAATVSWWHVLTSSSSSAATAASWFVSPSLGNTRDRDALIEGLSEGLIQAIAVHASPLDDEECLLPPDQRQRGIAGHQHVLPSLWQALVVSKGWTAERLWDVLSFGPARLLGVTEERLIPGSNRWLLFDPDVIWTPSRSDPWASRAANQPCLDGPLRGRVVQYGLRRPASPVD
ncbi:MAG: dihydroorotase [Synechococcus sp. CPC100]|nr:dihydroorotase [Synechococcus sp. CPC100]|tara:strand:- start:484 stop:1764 length:1281 start_codon:yes stop_codon:yes gene_type:complete